MSTIRYTQSVTHVDSGIAPSVTNSYVSAESIFTSIIETVLDTPVTTVDYGSVITPRFVQLQLLEGDDVEISLDAGSTWPLRLSGADDVANLRLNIEDYREISTATTTADVAGSLSGKYFDLTAYSGPVRVWMLTPARAEVSKVTAVADVAGSLDGKGFILYDAAGSVGVWFDHGDSGTAAPIDVAACARTIEITACNNDDPVSTVAYNIQQALNTDAAFSASTDGIDTVTVTDAAVGARTDAADSVSAASGFTFLTSTQGVTLASAPSVPALGRNLQVSVANDASAATVADTLAAALTADSEFIATSDGVSLVTITDQHLGTRTNIVDGTTGWVLATTQNGAAAPTVQVSSAVTGGSASVVITVAPN